MSFSTALHNYFEHPLPLRPVTVVAKVISTATTADGAIVAIVLDITASADITVVVVLAAVVVPAATAFAIAAIVGEAVTVVVVCCVDW